MGLLETQIMQNFLGAGGLRPPRTPPGYETPPLRHIPVSYERSPLPRAPSPGPWPLN